ncbi:MAG: PadR family transcriptional regulator [Actinomycetota bacterium]|nr:PadR family transcriptional regulator [Actinomycetota bacterium]MDQ6947173.1 PadR family transcriptional regulator [Actinomycetota bacterium]
MGAELVKGQLDLLLLGVLRHGPRHGYAVISELRDRTGGTFDLPEGTVYPALHRLQDDGLLASDWQDRAGRRRRVYRLTDAGQVALSSENARWRRMATAVDAVLGTGPSLSGTPA